MHGGRRVTVVFPAFNEAPYIRAAVEDFFSSGVVDEIVVVDNNSRDGTADVAQAAGARVVHEAKQGYGHALQRGLREARGDIVVLAEPDGTFMGRDVHKLLAYADEHDIPRFKAGAPAKAFLRGPEREEIPLRFVRVEPYVVPKRSLTGDNAERVDTRVLQVLYALAAERPTPVFVGQQMDVYLRADPPEGLALEVGRADRPFGD